MPSVPSKISQKASPEFFFRRTASFVECLCFSFRFLCRRLLLRSRPPFPAIFRPLVKLPQNVWNKTMELSLSSIGEAEEGKAFECFHLCRVNSHNLKVFKCKLTFRRCWTQPLPIGWQAAIDSVLSDSPNITSNGRALTRSKIHIGNAWTRRSWWAALDEAFHWNDESSSMIQMFVCRKDNLIQENVSVSNMDRSYCLQSI